MDRLRERDAKEIGEFLFEIFSFLFSCITSSSFSFSFLSKF